MDLITGLPSSDGYDAILTIVDHGCSRAAIFLPCCMTISGPQIAQKYFQHVYPWFGIPDKVISDRDPHFTLHFGRGLAKELGVTQNILTAFHPQTDGLTERTNQWLEQYLRLVTAHQEDWSKWLPLATAVHNNSLNATLKTTPHQLIMGIDPPLTPNQRSIASNAVAHD